MNADWVEILQPFHIGADFRLSAKQILEIERLASRALREDLDLYLTSDE